MATYKWQSAGGKATAIVSRKRAIEGYYANPNICLQCGKVIEIPDGAKVSEIRQKKFCDHSCASIYSNSHRTRQRKTRIGKCLSCGRELDLSLNKKRKYCDSCLTTKRVSSTSKRQGRNATEILSNRTKDDVFSGRSGWQSARSSIRNHAKVVFVLSGQELKCQECGYDKYAEVCHIKPVSEFSGDSLISEVNSISNLIPLCPNHHWEFDHGLLNIAGNSTGVSENRPIT